MTIKPRINSLTELEEKFKQSLSSNAGITQWNNDSIIRSLYQPVALELNRLNRETDAAFSAIQFQSATGVDLDQIADNYGITRRLPERAFCTASEYNITFYTEDTFGSINSGSNIVIPAGTKIFIGSSENTIEVIYETDRDYTLPASSKRMAVGARAITIGASQNVGRSALNFHNFTNYRDSINGSLKVTNVFPILNGENIETDESLRYKIYSRYGSLVRESRKSILIDAMDVPGVEDIIVLPGYYGVGSLGVFVFGAEGLGNDRMLDEVQERITASNPPGTRIIVKNGICNYLDIEMTLWVPADLEASAYQDYRRIAREEYLGFIKGNARSNALNFENLKRRILQRVKGRVGVMSQQVEDKIFDGIFIRKDYGERLNSSSERIKIISSTYALKDEEYLKAGTLNINFDTMPES